MWHKSLGFMGFVENLHGGSMRVFCQGPQEDLKRFIKRARKPPAPIRVKEFNVKEVKPKPRLRYFRIKYGPVQEDAGHISWITGTSSEVIAVNLGTIDLSSGAS